MGKENYYDFAENDYEMLLVLIKNGQVKNAMCSLSQSICEKYLKHIINTYIEQTSENFQAYNSAIRIRNLSIICKFIKQYLPDFDFSTDKICQANEYYYSFRYPGTNSSFVSEEDVNNCWEAVQYTKNIVDEFINK